MCLSANALLRVERVVLILVPWLRESLQQQMLNWINGITGFNTI